MKIAVAYNCDNEIDISPVDMSICYALRELGHEVTGFPVLSSDSMDKHMDILETADLVFNSFDGFDDDPKSEILFARCLEETDVLFTGESSKVLDLTLNKHDTNSLLDLGGICTPNNCIFPIHPDFSFPYILKPNKNHCSNLITLNSVVYDVQGLNRQINQLRNIGCLEILIERYIEGREFTVSVICINGFMEILGISEIIFDGFPNIRTFESKQQDFSFYICSNLSDAENQLLSDIALHACEIIGCSHYARLDFRRDEDGKFYLLEMNANPDISPESSVMFHAKQSGKTFRDLIEIIVLSAIHRFNLSAKKKE